MKTKSEDDMKRSSTKMTFMKLSSQGSKRRAATPDSSSMPMNSNRFFGKAWEKFKNRSSMKMTKHSYD